MNCRRCGTPLRKPGDYCLTCNTANANAVVVEFEADRARLTMLDEDEVVGETTVTTRPETDEQLTQIQLRNFAGRVADELRRKRPDTVYAAGAREPPARRARRSTTSSTASPTRASTRSPTAIASTRTPSFRGCSPVAATAHWISSRRHRARRSAGPTRRSSAIARGGRRSARSRNIRMSRKIVPGPIDAGGTGSRTGLRAKATRAGTNGNIRLLLRDGSSVQENRIVTTAMDRETGERVREDLNEALRDAELQDE